MNSKQSQRTRQAIINAFLRLLNRKSFEKIVVQDLLEETPISRGAFYSYFHDKYDIAEYLQDMLLSSIEGLGYSLVFHDLENTGELPHALPETFKELRPVLLALLKIKTDKVDIMSRLTENIRKGYAGRANISDERFAETEADMYADIHARFIVYTLMNDSMDSAFMYDFRRMYTDVFFRLLTIDPENEKRLRDEIDRTVENVHKIILNQKSYE